MTNTMISTTLSALLATSAVLQADTLLLPPGSDIQAAIDVLGDGDTIQLQSGVYQPTETLTMNGKAITLIGELDSDGVLSSTIDGQDKIRIIECDSGETADTRFENLILRNGWVDGQGAAVICKGFIFESAAVPTFVNCAFLDNTATGSGGAVYTNQTRPSFIGCFFYRNTTSLSGGAVANRLSETVYEDCMFIENESIGKSSVGGAMYNYQSPVSVTDTVFETNTSTLGGGAVFNERSFSSGTFESCTFTDNETGGSGGHVYNLEARPRFLNSTFEEGRADWTGGGIHCTAGAIEFTDCLMRGNIAAFSEGGGLYIEEMNAATLVDCTLIGNRSRSGGGISSRTGSTLDLTGCTLQANRATVLDGGALFNHGSEATAIDCSFTENDAVGNGGAIFCDAEATILVRESDFTMNDAENGGAALHNSFSSNTYRSCTFDLNSAEFLGGAILNSAFSPALVVNCEFNSNVAGTGGAYSDLQSDSNITGCLFTDNRSEAGNGGAVYCSSSNTSWSSCVFEGNSTPSFGGGLYFFGLGSTPSITDSTIRENTGDVGGGLYNANTTLSIAGTTICSNTTDQVQPVDGYVDDGDNTIELSCDCPGDLNGDGLVDGADLTILLADWGLFVNSLADLNGDGLVDGADLSALLGDWGACSS